MMRKAMQHIHVVLQNLDGLFVRSLDGRDDLFVDLRGGLSRAGKGGISGKVLVRNGLERDHVEFAAHAVAG